MDKYQIIESIKNNSIEVADFTNTELTDDDCLKLSNIIVNNHSVSKLIIRNLDIPVGINYIFDTLKTNKYIKSIILNNITFNDKNYYFLSEMLKYNKYIQKIDLDVKYKDDSKNSDFNTYFKLFCDSLIIHNNLLTFKINLEFNRLSNMLFDSLTTNISLKSLTIKNYRLDKFSIKYIDSFIKLFDNHQNLTKLTIYNLELGKHKNGIFYKSNTISIF